MRIVWKENVRDKMFPLHAIQNWGKWGTFSAGEWRQLMWLALRGGRGLLRYVKWRMGGGSMATGGLMGRMSNGCTRWWWYRRGRAVRKDPDPECVSPVLSIGQCRCSLVLPFSEFSQKYLSKMADTKPKMKNEKKPLNRQNSSWYNLSFLDYG